MREGCGSSEASISIVVTSDEHGAKNDEGPMKNDECEVSSDEWQETRDERVVADDY